jgi:O-antigen/teichoic acid export membrane protein
MNPIKKLRSLSENSRIVLRNVVGAFTVKGLSLLISLFTMPAYLDFFDNQTALGLWFTVLSVLNWMLNFDFGIGNGLRNHLTKRLAEKNYPEAKRYVSSAYLSIGGVCLAALVIFLAVFGIIPWNTVFRIDSAIVSEGALRLSVLIVFVGILLQMFLRLINSVMYAIQLSSVNNFMNLCTSVLTLSAVLLIPSQGNDENFVIMAVVHALAVMIPQIIATLAVFCFSRYKSISPSLHEYGKPYAKEVLSLGGSFFYVQIMYMLIMNTNEYLVTLLTGNDLVVSYSFYHKIFTLGSTLFSLALTPIWSAVTKAITEKNHKWVKSLYKKMLFFGLAGTCCEFLIVPVLQLIINFWLQEDAFAVNYGYAAVFAMMGSLMIFNSVFSSIANGLGKLKTQIIFFTVGAVVKVALAYVLVSVTDSWIGVLIANAVAMGIYCVVQPITLRRALKELSAAEAETESSS